MSNKLCRYPAFGQNLRQCRKRQQLSVQDMTGRLAALSIVTPSGAPYSEKAYRDWESGASGVPDDVKIALCHILNVRLEALFCAHLQSSPAFTKKIRLCTGLGDWLSELPEDALEQLDYIANRWPGDAHALLAVALAYCAVENPARRAEMAASMMMIYDHEREAHRLFPDAPEVSPDALWASIRRLEK